MQASFKLKKVLGGLLHYGEVIVDATPAPVSEIVIAPDAFAWLKEHYGPHAWEWAICDDYRAEATAGCRFALEREPTGHPMRVEVKQIRAHPALTVPGDLVYAACAALREAIGSGVDVWPELRSPRAGG